MTPIVFICLAYNAEHDFWDCVFVKDGEEEALAEKRRLEGKGADNLYLFRSDAMNGLPERRGDERG